MAINDEKETIEIPPLPKVPKSLVEKSKRIEIWVTSLGLFICFLILLAAVTYLPIGFSLKVMALLIGSFLLIDIHKSIKLRLYA